MEMYLFAFVSSSDYTYKTKTVFLQFLVSQGKKADALLKCFFFLLLILLRVDMLGVKQEQVSNLNQTRFGSKGVKVCVGGQRSRFREQRNPAPVSFTPACCDRLHLSFLCDLPQWAPLSSSQRTDKRMWNILLTCSVVSLQMFHCLLCLPASERNQPVAWYTQLQVSGS